MPADLGAATSGATFFRQMGGSFGTAVFGAIFAGVLGGELTRSLRGVQVPAGLSGASVSPAALTRLPAAAHHGYVLAYAHSLQTVLLIAVPIGAVAFLLTFLLPEISLRSTITTTHATSEPVEGPLAGSSSAGGAPRPPASTRTAR